MPGTEWSGAETAALLDCCRIKDGRYVLAYSDKLIAARMQKLFPARKFTRSTIRSHLRYLKVPAHERLDRTTGRYTDRSQSRAYKA